MPSLEQAQYNSILQLESRSVWAVKHKVYWSLRYDSSGWQKNDYKGEPTTTWLLFLAFIDFVMRKEDENGSRDDAETKLKFSRVSTN